MKKNIKEQVIDYLKFKALGEKEVVVRDIKRAINHLLEIDISEDLRLLRQKIQLKKYEGYVVGVVCMTGDLMLPGHINYVKTARKKIEDRLKKEGVDKPIYLIVGLEDSKRTKQRKGKETILNNEERKYQWFSNKYVDDVFIWNVPLSRYPSDLMLFLGPDFWISHEEYFDFRKYLKVAKKLERGGLDKVRPLVVTFEDHNKLPEGNIRNRWNISTSNVVKRIIEKQPVMLKKYKSKLLEIIKGKYEKNYN